MQDAGLLVAAAAVADSDEPVEISSQLTQKVAGTNIDAGAFEHRQLKRPTEVKEQELSKAVSPSVQKHREQHLFSRPITYSQTKYDQSCS